jgi:hypothetical protein
MASVETVAAVGDECATAAGKVWIGDAMTRPHLEHLHSPELQPRPIDWRGWPAGASVKVLSVDDETGALSALLTLPDGWRRPPVVVLSDSELVVVSGELRIGEYDFSKASYCFVPAGQRDQEWQAVGPTELFFAARSGAPDVRSGAGHASTGTAIRLKAADLPWGPTPIPNGPPNINGVAILRPTETGEMSALVRGGPRSYPVYEFHECVEEVFLIDGDITVGPAGEMRPGSYFWRPPYITHGQSHSKTGTLYYLYTDSPLINRVTDGWRTAAENRAQLDADLAAHASPSTS